MKEFIIRNIVIPLLRRGGYIIDSGDNLERLLNPSNGLELYAIIDKDSGFFHVDELGRPDVFLTRREAEEEIFNNYPSPHNYYVDRWTTK